MQLLGFFPEKADQLRSFQFLQFLFRFTEQCFNLLIAHLDLFLRPSEGPMIVHELPDVLIGMNTMTEFIIKEHDQIVDQMFM